MFRVQVYIAFAVYICIYTYLSFLFNVLLLGPLILKCDMLKSGMSVRQAEGYPNTTY